MKPLFYIIMFMSFLWSFSLKANSSHECHNVTEDYIEWDIERAKNKGANQLTCGNLLIDVSTSTCTKTYRHRFGEAIRNYRIFMYKTWFITKNTPIFSKERATELDTRFFASIDSLPSGDEIYDIVSEEVKLFNDNKCTQAVSNLLANLQSANSSYKILSLVYSMPYNNTTNKSFYENEKFLKTEERNLPAFTLIDSKISELNSIVTKGQDVLYFLHSTCKTYIPLKKSTTTTTTTTTTTCNFWWC